MLEEVPHGGEGRGGREGARLFLCHSNIHIYILWRCRYHRAWLKLPFFAFNRRDHISLQIAAIFVCSRECYLWQATDLPIWWGEGRKANFHPSPSAFMYNTEWPLLGRIVALFIPARLQRLSVDRSSMLKHRTATSQGREKRKDLKFFSPPSYFRKSGKERSKRRRGWSLRNGSSKSSEFSSLFQNVNKWLTRSPPHFFLYRSITCLSLRLRQTNDLPAPGKSRCSSQPRSIIVKCS